MRAYYNEIDKNAAEWIRELIKEGVVTDGEVDERSIEDVLPADLRGFDRCHFFAGIAAWDYALNLAGWEGQVWTGSCPCQPFSTAGKRGGFDDERHLWPAWFYLIEQCRPHTVFGEQVASKDGLTWLDLVSADVEGIGYSIGAVDLPAAGVGAPHKRQRFYFGVGHADAYGSQSRGHNRSPNGTGKEARIRSGVDAEYGGRDMRLEDSKRIGRRRGSKRPAQPEICRSGSTEVQTPRSSNSSGVALGDTGDERLQGCAAEGLLPRGRSANRYGGQTGSTNSNEGVGQADTQRTELTRYNSEEGRSLGCGELNDGVCLADTTSIRLWQRAGGQIEEGLQPRPDEAGIIPSGLEGRGFTNGFWAGANWVYCADPDGPKWRAVEPGTFPLVTRTPGDVALIRGAGNAISPWAAKAFIESWREVKQDTAAA